MYTFYFRFFEVEPDFLRENRFLHIQANMMKTIRHEEMFGTKVSTELNDDNFRSLETFIPTGRLFYDTRRMAYLHVTI